MKIFTKEKWPNTYGKLTIRRTTDKEVAQTGIPFVVEAPTYVPEHKAIIAWFPYRPHAEIFVSLVNRYLKEKNNGK